MPLIPLDNLLGAQLIGLIVSSVVYGITCLQVYLYYTEYASKDRPWLRLYVALIMMLDTLHIALVAHTTYYWTVTSFGDYFALGNDVWSLLVQIMIGSTIFVAFEWWFAWRIYRLSGDSNWWIPTTMIILSLAHWGLAMNYTLKGFEILVITKAAEDLPWGWAAFSAEFACDVVMTSAMIYYLKKNRTQFSRTNRAVNMLVTYTLNTGLLVMIFTLITLAMTIVNQKTLVYTPFYYVLIRLYSCSFMSTLNTRHTVRSALEGVREVITLSPIGSSAQTAASGGDARQVLDLKLEAEPSLV